MLVREQQSSFEDQGVPDMTRCPYPGNYKGQGEWMLCRRGCCPLLISVAPESRWRLMKTSDHSDEQIN